MTDIYKNKTTLNNYFKDFKHNVTRFHSMQACIVSPNSYEMPKDGITKYSPLKESGSEPIRFYSYETPIATATRVPIKYMSNEYIRQRDFFGDVDTFVSSFDLTTTAFFEIELTKYFDYSPTTRRQLVRFLNESTNTQDLTIGIVRTLRNMCVKKGKPITIECAPFARYANPIRNSPIGFRQLERVVIAFDFLERKGK